MGLRSWLLGFNPEEVKVLMQQVQALDQEVKKLRNRLTIMEVRLDDLAKGYQDILKELLRIQEDLNSKADKKDMERELESLSKLIMATYDKLKDLEALSDFSLGENLDQKEEELLVLNLLRQGYTSPSELMRKLKFGNKKLYAILKRLEAMGKVRKLRKGKKVNYVLIED